MKSSNRDTNQILFTIILMMCNAFFLGVVIYDNVIPLIILLTSSVTLNMCSLADLISQRE